MRRYSLEEAYREALYPEDIHRAWYRAEEVDTKIGALKKEVAMLKDAALGTPCEQIKHGQEVEELKLFIVEQTVPRGWYERQKREIVVLQEWRAKAFIAHPNIDIDIDAAMEAENAE
jgi:hypothetical protein